jgi:hypothetical protein
MKRLLLVLFICISALALAAREKMSSGTNAAKSIDGIVKEVLRLVSGEKGRAETGRHCVTCFYRPLLLRFSTIPIQLGD